MNINTKARRASDALRQLRGEEWERGNRAIFTAIDEYLGSAPRSSLARLYDLVKADIRPEPFG